MMRQHLISNGIVEGVRSGSLAVVRGQGGVGRDVIEQVASSLRKIDEALRALGGELKDVTKLLIAFDGATGLTDRQVIDLVAKALPPASATTATAVPRPALRLSETLVEIEAVAMIGLPRTTCVLDSTISPLGSIVDGVRTGEMIWLSGRTAIDQDGRSLHPGDIVAQTHNVMDQLGHVLAHFGAGFDDVVKQHRWGSGVPTHQAWAPAARACADRYVEPGPVATAIAVPRDYVGDVLIKVEMTAMLGLDGRRLPRQHSWPEGLWDWPIHLPYKHGLKCSDMIFVGGQVSLDPQANVVAPYDMATQTANTMGHIKAILRDLGATPSHALLVTDFYEGSKQPDDTAKNVKGCISAFPTPGPAVTTLPATFRSYDGMMTEIEVMARLD